MSKTLFLVDAMAIIYRAHFALSKNPFINSKGQNTSATYGFTNTLFDIISNQNPTHIGIAFDMSDPTFRHKMYSEYKANREKQPEDITSNIPWIKELITAFNIPIFEKKMYEADDIIGTLAKKAEEYNFKTFMFTPDKDYAQLVTGKTSLYRPGYGFAKTETLNVKGVCEKFDVENVNQVIDILGLQGDPSDNIPGVAGIGAKTASKLLKEYHSIENIIENVDKLTGKVKEYISKNINNAILSKKLATIVTDLDIEFDEEALLIKRPNLRQLKSLFNILEFRTLAKRIIKAYTVPPNSAIQPSLFDTPNTDKGVILDNNHKTIKDVKPKYTLVQSDEELTSLVQKLSDSKTFAFDTETTSLDAIHAELVGLSFCIEVNKAYYVPVIEDNASKILEYFKPIFFNDKILKVGHNIKYDLLILLNYGINVKGPFYDTMIADYILNPEGKHSLDYLAKTYLDYETIKIETLIGIKKQGSMRNAPLEQVKDYAAEDADITMQLKIYLDKKINNKNHALNLLNHTEFPLISILAHMEHEGINIDREQLTNYSSLLSEEIKILRQKIYNLADAEFNISSPKQLGEILFDKLKIIDKPKKTKTGQYATGEEVLSRLKSFPIAKTILDYRECQKLKNTYVDALLKINSPKDKRIHTNFSQTIVATGRLSSNNPNLQNIPIRTSRGREIRKCFIPCDSRYTLLSADYSQMELRIMASFAEDEVMIDAFKNNIDIHKSTASKIFNIALNDVTDDQRRIAKTANFGIIYGISAFGLSQQLEISRKEAAEIIDSYFENFSSVKAYTEKIKKFAREKGYVETVLKRRRYLRDINSRNNTQKNFAERNAVNAPIQGTAADITKMAMVNVDKWIKSNNLKSKMLLQVHDELVFDVYKEEKELFDTNLPNLMSDVSTLVVPMEVNLGYGENWLVAH